MEWGEYRLGDLFEVNTAKSFDEGKLVLKKKYQKGLYEFVGRTNVNNGIKGYVSKQQTKPNSNNVISVSQIGTVTAQLRKNYWYASQNIFILTSKYKELISLFGISTINTSLDGNFSSGYSNYPTLRKLNELIIQLPTKNGEIDFEFMEAFIAELEAQHISELEAQHIAELEAYLEATGLKDYQLTNEEKQVLTDFENGKFEWVEYRLGDLFEIKTGRDVIIGDVLKGNIPLISHQHDNNGISKYISRLENRNLFNFKKTISVADRGVFLATTQNKNFHIGTRVKVLVFNKEKSINERLFFIVSINKLQILFTDYSANATGNLPNLKIKLPTKNEQPDYALMEILVSAIQKTVIKDVVLYADRKIATTKQVVDK